MSRKKIRENEKTTTDPSDEALERYAKEILGRFAELVEEIYRGGITQEAMAKKMGIGVSTVNDWVNGRIKKGPTLASFSRLIALYPDFDLNRLFRREVIATEFRELQIEEQKVKDAVVTIMEKGRARLFESIKIFCDSFLANTYAELQAEVMREWNLLRRDLSLPEIELKNGRPMVGQFAIMEKLLSEQELEKHLARHREKGDCRFLDYLRECGVITNIQQRSILLRQEEWKRIRKAVN